MLQVSPSSMNRFDAEQASLFVGGRDQVSSRATGAALQRVLGTERGCQVCRADCGTATGTVSDMKKKQESM
eukprot:753915-Hanusia_phi.AAC.14